jgi:uncharacterized membrane protein YjjP (DUF1212 family)
MKPAQPKTDSKQPSAWIKWVVVAGVSLCGGVILHLLEGNLQSGDFIISIAGIIGTTFVPFAVAMLVAIFIRGWAGVWVGTTSPSSSSDSCHLVLALKPSRRKI